MYYHVLLTGECNLHCKYCGGSFNEKEVPFELQYSIDELKHFLMQDPERSIAFYGGEPLLNIPKMLEIMNEIPAKYYSIQTNGILLDQIPVEYLSKFHTILVSIDGRPEITDYYRKIGKESIYETVLNNAKWLRKNGFKGDLIARMAVSIKSDIFQEVTHLLSIKENQNKLLFDHVHWQLDVQWGTEGILWSKTRSIKKIDWTNFDNWVVKIYNPGIKKLAEFWLNNLEKGKILGIVPFITVMNDLLNDRSTVIRCGSGQDCFAINPNGSITSCPIAHGDGFKVGNIRINSPKEILNSMPVGGPCTSCEVFNTCGGRCLYANKTKFWGKLGFEKVCNTVKHFITVLKDIKPKIQELIKNSTIKRKDLAYPVFNNGCEIIP